MKERLAAQEHPKDHPETRSRIQKLQHVQGTKAEARYHPGGLVEAARNAYGTMAGELLRVRYPAEQLTGLWWEQGSHLKMCNVVGV